MSKYVTFDKSKYPIVVLNFSPNEPTKEEFEEYLNEMSLFYQEHSRFVYIFEASKTKYLSSELRSVQAKWIKANTTKIKEKCAGMVYILPNMMLEVIFKCIIAFSPLPVKYTTVRNMNDAFREAEKMLK